MKNKQLDFIGFLSVTNEVIFTTSPRDVFDNPSDVDFNTEKKMITITRGKEVVYLSELENELVDVIKKDGGFTVLILDNDGDVLVRHRYGPAHNHSPVVKKMSLSCIENIE